MPTHSLPDPLAADETTHPTHNITIPAGPPPRHDGWTPQRQREFLLCLSQGSTVTDACAAVGLSVASAYAFRTRAGGAAFAIGWAAANLLARERLADTLLERALEGQTETVTYATGATADRHRYDNRLAMSLLTRLDKQAEGGGAAAHAARLVAQEFEAFTHAIARDASPARAGLFIGTRTVTAPQPDLAPLVALARADRFARSGAALADEVDVADLDLSARAGWNADQWQRAEAAGLLAIAVADAPDPQLPQLAEPEPQAEAGDPPPVWRGADDEWYTHFPPPADFYGEQWGEWGQTPEYERRLSPEEAYAWHAIRAATPDPERDAEAVERDVFFGFAQRDDRTPEPSIASEGEGRTDLDQDGARPPGYHDNTQPRHPELISRQGLGSGQPAATTPTIRQWTPCPETSSG